MKVLMLSFPTTLFTLYLWKLDQRCSKNFSECSNQMAKLSFPMFARAGSHSLFTLPTFVGVLKKKDLSKQSLTFYTYSFPLSEFSISTILSRKKIAIAPILLSNQTSSKNSCNPPVFQMFPKIFLFMPIRQF